MKTLLFITLLFSTSIFAKIDCQKHKVYCKIKELRPNMSFKKAMKLSNIIYNKSKKYKGDANLAVAIGMQETSLKERHRQQNIIQFQKECEEESCKESWHVLRGYSDICMFQFHVNTIVANKIDPVKLKNDLEYCVDWHFRLMNQKKRICKELADDAWTCYHSKSKVLRLHYKKLVERYL